MKFSELIKCNISNIFLEIFSTTSGREASRKPFIKSHILA